jgi:hypothetical protein
MPDPQEIARKARALVDIARSIVSHFAQNDLAPEDLTDLLFAVGLETSEWPQQDLSVLLPLPRGRRHLYVQESAPPAAKLWVVLVEIGLHLAGEDEDARVVAEVFATCGTLVPSAHAPDARGEIRRRILALAGAHPEGWYRNRFTRRLYPAAQLTVQGAWSEPETAALALELGRAARRASQHDQADAMFSRAVELATAAGDWTAVADAQICLGILARQRGNFPEARRRLSVAVVTAHRCPAEEVRARAHHELFATAYLSGDFGSGTHHAREALRAYGPENPLAVRLAGDVASSFLLQGHHQLALAVLRAISPKIQEPRLVTTLFATKCRAAGGAQDLAAFVDAWDRACLAIARQATRDGVAEALLDMAHGAALIGDERRAQKAAAQALELARDRREERVVVDAEALLVDMQTGHPQQQGRPVDDAGYLDGEALAVELVNAFADTVPA